MEIGNPILVCISIVNKQNFGHGKKRNTSFSPSSFLLSYMDVKFGVVASLERLSKSLKQQRSLSQILLHAQQIASLLHADIHD